MTPPDDMERPDHAAADAASPGEGAGRAIDGLFHRGRLRRFLFGRDGAVTVDWVVLTAAFAGLGVAVGAMLWDSMSPQADSLGRFLNEQEIQTTF